MVVFKIDVVADTVCPFCYAASKQISNAIAAYKQNYPTATDEFVIRWHPFFLNESPPKPSVEKEHYFIEKFGVGMLDRIYQSQEAIGKENGIKFNKAGKIGDTRDSHRLIYLAGAKSSNIQSSIVSAVYKAYFEDGEDISSKDTLITIAVNAGIDKKEARKWLKDDVGGTEVDVEAASARAQGIRSVPHIKISDHTMSGRRDIQSFLAVFQNVKAEQL